MQLLKNILTRMELKKGKVGMNTVGLEAGMLMHASSDKIPEQENFEVDLVHLNVKNAGAVSRQVTLTEKSKEKEKIRGDRSPPVKGKRTEFSKALKAKLQQKDWENQQIVHMLLIKHQELRDITEMWQLKEANAQLKAEKPKQDEQKNCEVTERFNSVCEDIRAEICIAKSNNEDFVQQLKALLEKYERLQKRASSFKDQLIEQHTKKEMYQKTLKKTQLIAEELLMNRTLLEGQKDDAMRELSACREKMQAMEEEHKQYARTIKAAEEERSDLKAEYGNLSDQLCKTQVENKKLTQAVQFKELEKERAEKNLQESQKAVKQLYEELNDSKRKTESIYLHLESMKKKFKILQNGHKVEILHLNEQQKAYIEQFEAMKTECESLNVVVSKLKKDNRVLKEKLEHLRKEKLKSETACNQEVGRLREAVGLLEQEREILLNEMGDLRKDYFSLSDRITQRLGELDQNDDPMCITEISSVHHPQAPKTDKTVAPTTSMRMMEQIRRKLEKEDECFSKETGALIQK